MFKTKKDEAPLNTKNVVYRYFFSGTYVERMDNKNRIAIPIPWRHILRDKVIVTKNTNVGCLVVWTVGFFQWYANSKIESYASEQEKQQFKRMFIGSARTIDIDAKSRMCLPEDLLTMLVQQDNYLYFVGTGDYIEIWTKEMFESWKSQQMPKDYKNEDL